MHLRRGVASGLLRGWLGLVLLPAAGRATHGGPAYPRLANVYLHGAVDPADIAALARWDVLVLDSVWSSAQLAQLRALNPDIKIFYYVCPYCIAVPPAPGDAWRRLNYEYVQSNDLWWRNADRSIASDWPGVKLVNLTDLAPEGTWGTWRKVLGARVEELMRSRPQLDGVFYDNFWKSISWEQGTTIHVDSDCSPRRNPAGCNGVADPPAQLDSLWNRALRAVAKDTRARFTVLNRERDPNRPLAILSNSSTDYFPWLNGTLHEYFLAGRMPPDPGNPHGYNWIHEMLATPGGYLVAPFRDDPYQLSILNATWAGGWDAPDRSGEFERYKRFTLVSALLGDGYYSLDAGAAGGHGSLWWEPEFDGGGLGPGYLGYPLGPAQRIGRSTGPELVANGGFALTPWPWQSQGVRATGSYALDGVTYHSAPSAARLTVTSLTPGGSFKLYQTVPVMGGFGFTLTFWARASVPQEILVHLYSEDCPDLRCLGDQRFRVGTAWKSFEMPFVSTGNASAGLNIFVQTPGTVWVDDVSLRWGETSVYRRDFDRGTVLLNYTTAPRPVVLGATYWRLSIPGSPVFDGAPVSVEMVPPFDARILLRARQPTPSPLPPERGAALANDPDPFAGGTAIRFRMEESGPARLVVYDVAGRLVRTLLERPLGAGTAQQVSWDGTDAQGRRAAPGVYFARLTTPRRTHTEKMVLLP